MRAATKALRPPRHKGSRTRLAFADTSGRARLWDTTARGSAAADLGAVALDEQRAGVATVMPTAFAPGSDLIALASYDGRVRVARVADGATVATLDLGAARADTATALAWSRAHLWIGTARGAVLRYRVAR